MSRLFIFVSFLLVANVSCANKVAYRSHVTRCGGASGNSCVADVSTCQADKCACKAPFTWGDAAFACYTQNTVAAESRNDPALTNFNNETLPFHFPCRYLFTHVRQDLVAKGGKVVGDCEFKIYAFNAKYRGKFFTHGFDVAMEMNYDNGRIVKRSSRHWGIAYRGRYVFHYNGTNKVFLPNGPWESSPIGYNDNRNRIKLSAFVSKPSNQFVYEVKRCGVKITFVPFDIKLRRKQVSQPGLSVGIDHNMNPQWLSHHRALALPPVNDEGGSLFSQHRMHGLNEEESLLVRAFTKYSIQNQPNDDEGQCHAVASAFSRCSRRERSGAMTSCYWMLKQPRYIRCMDSSTSAKKVLEVFASCIRAWCGRESCSTVQAQITEAGCHELPRIDELAKFMAGDMCPKHEINVQ